MEFYKRARPLGFWGPIRKKLGIGPEKHRNLIGKGFCIALLGTAFFGSIVLMLSNLFVGKYSVAAGLAVAIVVTGLIFRKVFGWYIGVLIERTGGEEDADSPASA